MKEPGNSLKAEIWIQDFEMLYKRCARHKINMSDKYNTLLDMLTAIGKWNESFASHYRREITDQIGQPNGEAKMINPLDLAHRFREELELQKSTQQRVNHNHSGAFVTLKGLPESDQTAQNRSPSRRCFCGGTHRYNKC